MFHIVVSRNRETNKIVGVLTVDSMIRHDGVLSNATDHADIRAVTGAATFHRPAKFLRRNQARAAAAVLNSELSNCWKWSVVRVGKHKRNVRTIKAWEVHRDVSYGETLGTLLTTHRTRSKAREIVREMNEEYKMYGLPERFYAKPVYAEGAR